MTDAPILPDPEPKAEEEPLAIVPTLSGFLALSGRVETLERLAGPTVPPGAVQAPPEAVQDRLNRHREDIEEVKRRYNALLRYLQSVGIVPVDDTTTPEERYQ